MPTTCQFEFSRATPIYYSGEQISGSIILRTTKRLSVEGKYVNMRVALITQIYLSSRISLKIPANAKEGNLKWVIASKIKPEISEPAIAS